MIYSILKSFYPFCTMVFNGSGLWKPRLLQVALPVKNAGYGSGNAIIVVQA